MRSTQPYVQQMLVSIMLALCLVLPPVPGPVVAPFEPAGSYAGHWGLDLSAPDGSAVVAPLSGVVTFAGEVAGMRSVTIRSSDDIRISLSYLSQVHVRAGERVAAGQIVGRSGRAHGEDGVHLSVREGTRYVDPAPFVRCANGAIRLLPDR
ncbi:MAG TPA: M23 family metallopeptidase [Acidimicrobiia bacterium]